MNKKSEGVSLVEFMVALGVVSVLALGLVSYSVFNQAALKKSANQRQMDEISLYVKSVIESPVAWQNTLTAPENSGAMGCIRDAVSLCTPGAVSQGIALYGPGGQTLSSGVAGGRGLLRPGVTCNGYVAPPNPGNKDCPFRLRVDWKPECFVICDFPASRLDVTLEFNPGDAALAVSRSFTVYRRAGDFRRILDVDGYSSYQNGGVCIVDEFSRVKCFGHGIRAPLLGQEGEPVYPATHLATGAWRRDVLTLPPIQLGTDSSGNALKAVKVRVGPRRACAILDCPDGGCASRLKCWGNNSNGGLGLGDLNNRGGQPGTMGNALQFVEIGTDVGNFPFRVTDVAFTRDATCVVYQPNWAQYGQVKCWGKNTNGVVLPGQGQPETEVIGDEAAEMGNALPPLDFGAGVRVLQLVGHESHICALLNNGEAQCWGSNIYSQLGIQSSANFGSWYNDESARAAFLEDSARGGDITSPPAGAPIQPRYQAYGDDGGEALSNPWARLSFLAQAPPKRILKLAVGPNSTCVILEQGQTPRVHCWGLNKVTNNNLGPYEIRGVLGVPAYNVNVREDYIIGDQADDMSVRVPNNPVALGTTPVVDIVGGDTSYCAVLAGGNIKCWGSLGVPLLEGQLGLGMVFGDPEIALGDDPGEMGLNLLPVNLGTHQRLKKLISSEYSYCALTEEGALKCWGHAWSTNAFEMGTSGLQVVNIGDNPNEMGDYMPRIIPGFKDF